MSINSSQEHFNCEGLLMRVLVVEDDRALGVFLQKGLILEGHEVDWVSDGDTALERAAQQQPDLMVLDLGLPHRDGCEVLEAMGRDFESTAVLVLTGRSLVEERVRCLNMGADDFLQKPFSFHELLARCRALMRRRDRFSDPIVRFGGIEMDRIQRTVVFESSAVSLTTKEFGLLEFLMARKGSCCSRAELMHHLWHAAPDAGTNIVDVYVTYLRKKLAAARPDDPVAGGVIETVRGTGYRMRDKRKTPRINTHIKGGSQALNCGGGVDLIRRA
jgi:DNA-binding response OmpR family regulator